MDPTRETRAGPKTDLSLALAACETSTWLPCCVARSFCSLMVPWARSCSRAALRPVNFRSCSASPTPRRSARCMPPTLLPVPRSLPPTPLVPTRPSLAARQALRRSSRRRCPARARPAHATWRRILAPRVSSSRPWARFPSTTHTTSLPSRCVPPTLPVQTSL